MRHLTINGKPVTVGIKGAFNAKLFAAPPQAGAMEFGVLGLNRFGFGSSELLLWYNVQHAK
ncbi:MAG: hypothetical protein ACREBG_14620 [Pyrinomonadaceae bacterium]